jgi:ubiquinone/menaquinone biosynthesis C-methylase UbiE
MSDETDRYRFGFGAVAEHYERSRPSYAEASVDWAIDRLGIEAAGSVLDLAAGTGLLTRALVARGLDVVAVEPDEGMREVLSGVVPAVKALAGRAEKIPLPDDAVAAVFVGQAFHWFEPEAALAEMRRVVRPGGGFALFWNQFNQDDPVLGAVDELLRTRDPARRSNWRERYDPIHFGPLEERAFYEERQMNVDELAAWVASTSRVIAAGDTEKAEIEAEVRRLKSAHPGAVTIRTLVVAARPLS